MRLTYRDTQLQAWYNGKLMYWCTLDIGILHSPLTATPHSVCFITLKKVCLDMQFQPKVIIVEVEQQLY